MTLDIRATIAASRQTIDDGAADIRALLVLNAQADREYHEALARCDSDDTKTAEDWRQVTGKLLAKRGYIGKG